MTASAADVARYIPKVPVTLAGMTSAEIMSLRPELGNSPPSAASEPIPIRGSGTVFSAQRIFDRLMRYNPAMLLISEPGTGKTISFLTVAERFRREKAADRAFILVKGPTLAEEVKQTIIYKMAPEGVYETDALALATKASSKAGAMAVNKEVAKFYSVMTFGRFLRMFKEEILAAAPSSQEAILVKTFGRSLIVVDEAHSIVTADGSHEVEGRQDVYAAVSTVARYMLYKAPPSMRARVILATATPMINTPVELSHLANIILPEDRLLLKTTAAGSGESVCGVKKALRGIVSYVAAERSKAFVSLEGTDHELSEGLSFKAYENAMGDVQAAAFQAVHSTSDDAAASDDTVYRSALQSSIFVFPDGTHGSAAADKYMTTAGGKRASNEAYAFKRQYKAAIVAMLPRLSSKMTAIMEIEQEASARPGTAFIYSEYRKTGTGIMSAVLEAFGYEQFVPALARGGNAVAVAPKKRFAVLTPAMSREQQDVIKDTFNSPENVDGSRIKIMVGSKVTRDGINLFHVVRVHLLTPPWTASGALQAISRATRAVSHDDLAKIMPLPIKVSVYRHAAVSPETGDSIDLQVYAQAASKDFLVRQYMRALKETAADCLPNRSRNIASTANSADGSPECDYTSCQYVCDGGDMQQPTAAGGRDMVLKDTASAHREAKKLLLEKATAMGNVGKAVVSAPSVDVAKAIDNIIFSRGSLVDTPPYVFVSFSSQYTLSKPFDRSVAFSTEHSNYKIERPSEAVGAAAAARKRKSATVDEEAIEAAGFKKVSSNGLFVRPSDSKILDLRDKAVLQKKSLTGRVCTTYTKAEIEDMLKAANVVGSSTTKTKEGMCKELMRGQV